MKVKPLVCMHSYLQSVCVITKSQNLLAEAASLSVLSVDMRVMENTKDHITDKYKNSNLIVRRSKEFTIIIKFGRVFDEQQDNVQIEFLIGEKWFYRKKIFTT